VRDGAEREYGRALRDTFHRPARDLHNAGRLQQRRIAQKYSEHLRFWYSLNPAVGVIDGFRWCICGDPMYWPGFFLSIAVVLTFLWLGVRYFRQTERSFADNV